MPRERGLSSMEEIFFPEKDWSLMEGADSALEGSVSIRACRVHAYSASLETRKTVHEMHVGGSLRKTNPNPYSFPRFANAPPVV